MSVVRMRERECVLERVRIIEGFFKKIYANFHRDIGNCPK